MSEDIAAELDRLRLKAFASNSKADRDAYFNRLSLAYQRGELVSAATVSPDRPLCNECGWHGDREDLLEATHPFEPAGTTVYGCPSCREIITIEPPGASVGTKLASSEPLGPHYDGTTMDNQQLDGTTRRNQPVVTAGETAPQPHLSAGSVRDFLANAIDSPTVEALQKIFDDDNTDLSKTYGEEIVEVLVERFAILNMPNEPQAASKPRPMCLCCDEQEVSNDGDECQFCRITYSVSRPHGGGK